MNSIVKILNSAPLFISEVLKVLKSLNCDVSEYMLDHICYRTKTVNEYEVLKKEFIHHHHTLLADNEHNGREISVFRLKEPIISEGFEVNVFELPAPKKDKKYEFGYEHVEFVVPIDLRKLVSENTHLNFNIKNIDDQENPSVKLNLTIGSVKFHRRALSEIV